LQHGLAVVPDYVVKQILYIDLQAGNFKSFLSTKIGSRTVVTKNGEAKLQVTYCKLQ
jgi:hypothetical protein